MRLVPTIFVPPTTGNSGLPLWQTIPLAILGVAIAFGLVWGIWKLFSLPSERRILHRVHEVERAAGTSPPYNPQTVLAAATRLFQDLYKALNDGDRDRLQSISDPSFVSDWTKRLDGWAAQNDSYRAQIRGRPRLQYIGLLADRGLVRLRIRARLRRYLQKPRGKFQVPGEKGSFEEYWTLSWTGSDWVIYSTRGKGQRDEYLAEGIIPKAPEQSQHG